MVNSSLAQLRRGLHFSASALKSFLTCPWKFKLGYVEGHKPEFVPSAMILGRAVHEALAAHHEAIKAGQESKLEDISELLDTVVEAESKGDIPIHFQNGEDVASLRDTGRGLLDVYHREKPVQGRVVSVERGFQANLVDPRTREILEPKLVGIWDLIEENEDGNISVVEIKTAARRWSPSQVELDLQGSLYAEAAVQAGLVREDQDVQIVYRVMVKNKTPVLDIQTATRSADDRRKAMEIACDALRAIEAGSFFRNPSWACSGCQYRGACGI